MKASARATNSVILGRFLAAEHHALEAFELAHGLLDALTSSRGKKAGAFRAVILCGMAGQIPRDRAAARLALVS